MRAAIISLRDGKNRLDCGVIVDFVEQIPVEITNFNRRINIEDVEWDLENLGFDGVKISPDTGLIDFCETIENEIMRIGLHSKIRGNTGFVAVETCSNSPKIILHDGDEQKVKVSPVLTIRILKDIHGQITNPTQFWRLFKSETKRIKSLKIMLETNPAETLKLDGYCTDVIMDKYNSLNRQSRLRFLKWCEGDALSMFELARRM